MGGRFGKYGEAKRKARLRQCRVRPLDLRKQAKGKTSKAVRKRERPKDQRGGQ